ENTECIPPGDSLYCTAPSPRGGVQLFRRHCAMNGDLFEMLSIWVSLPFAVLAAGFWIATSLYVYFDAEARTRNRLFAACLVAAITVAYWPISFLAYVVCVASLDRRKERKRKAIVV